MTTASERNDMIAGTVLGFVQAFKWPAIVGAWVAALYALDLLAKLASPAFLLSASAWFPPAFAVAVALVTLSGYWTAWRHLAADWSATCGAPCPTPSRDHWRRSATRATVMAIIAGGTAWMWLRVWVWVMGQPESASSRPSVLVLLFMLLFILACIYAARNTGREAGDDDGPRP